MLFFCLWITPPQRITAFSAASVEFERFCEAWSKYHGAVRLLTTCTVDITGNGRIVSIIEDPALFLNDIHIFL